MYRKPVPPRTPAQMRAHLAERLRYTPRRQRELLAGVRRLSYGVALRIIQRALDAGQIDVIKGRYRAVNLAPRPSCWCRVCQRQRFGL